MRPSCLSSDDPIPKQVVFIFKQSQWQRQQITCWTSDPFHGAVDSSASSVAKLQYLILAWKNLIILLFYMIFFNPQQCNFTHGDFRYAARLRKSFNAVIDRGSDSHVSSERITCPNATCQRLLRKT